MDHQGIKVHMPGFQAKGLYFLRIQGSVTPTTGTTGEKLKGVAPQILGTI